MTISALGFQKNLTLLAGTCSTSGYTVPLKNLWLALCGVLLQNTVPMIHSAYQQSGWEMQDTIYSQTHMAHSHCFFYPCLLVIWLTRKSEMVHHLWGHWKTAPEELLSKECILCQSIFFWNAWWMNEWPVGTPLPTCHVCNWRDFKLMFAGARTFQLPNSRFLDSSILAFSPCFLFLPPPMGGARNKERRQGKEMSKCKKGIGKGQ